jgi:hypothetical protein
VEAYEVVAKVTGDVMRSRMAVRGVENVDSTRLQQLGHQLKVQLHILWVEMFQKLIAESDISTFSRPLQIESVVHYQLKVGRGQRSSRPLVGDVHTDDSLHLWCHDTGKVTVAWGKLHQGLVLAKN